VAKLTLAFSHVQINLWAAPVYSIMAPSLLCIVA